MNPWILFFLRALQSRIRHLRAHLETPSTHRQKWVVQSPFANVWIRRKIIDREHGLMLKIPPMREPNQTEKNDFYAAMDPRWKEVATLLAADRPPDWQGYRFEARVTCDNPAFPEKFTIDVTFGDRMSNRVRGGVQRNIVDKLAALRMSYWDFSPMATWRTVAIEQIWYPATKSWGFQTSWTY